MRRLTVAAACVAVFGCGPVAAADLSLKDTPVYAPAPAPSWNGPYIGGHLGGLWTGERTTSILEQVCRKPPVDVPDDEPAGGGDDDHPGGGDDDHPGGGDDDHDCKKSHYGEEHEDHKHGKRKGRKKSYASAPASTTRMSVVPKTTTTATTPTAPICTDWTKSGAVTVEDERDGVTLIGGVHVGYNWQRQSALVGVEADVDFADGFDYLASLRGRLGYVSGDLLLYATAGVAVGALSDNTATFTTPLASYSFERGDDRLVGAVVGAGVEYKLAANLSVGVEGLYYFFGDDSNSYSITEGDTAYRITEELDNDVWTVRARVSYHFGQDEDASLK